MPTLLVFGARNLGRVIARELGAAGWNAAGVARSEETIEHFRAELPDALGIVGDAGNGTDVERAFAETKERFGGIDLVITAITASPTFGGSIAEAPADALEPYVNGLLPGIFNVLRIGARELVAAGAGTLVQITGGSSRRGMPGRGPWAAAAFATRALVQAAAAELREQNVHVALLIVDATIESPKTEQWLAGKPPEESASMEEIAAAVAYLAAQSPRAWTHELQLTPAGDRWVP